MKFNKIVLTICTFLFLPVVNNSLNGAESYTDPKSGIDYKVIVTVNGGATVFDAPNGKVVGKKIAEMDIRFVMKPEGKNVAFLEEEGKMWFRISVDGETPVGWVKETEVSLWKTRSALKPNGVVGRNFIVKQSNGKQDIIYDGSAPDNYQLLAPILKPRSKEDEPYSVLVFGANTQGTFDDATSGKPKVSMDFKDAKVEIVFVVDTTASMQPLLDGVKEVVQQIAKNLGGSGNAESLNKRVRFGLVEYQDATPGLIPALVRIKMTDAIDFSAKINSKTKPVTVAVQGSVEWQEDVIAGLKMAVDRKKDGSFIGHVGWTQNSSKHIILCGDASALKADNKKSSTKETIDQVLKVALPSNNAEDAAKARSRITCHAIMALSDLEKRDREECRKDFKKVAASLSQNKKEQGDYAEMKANDAASKKEIVSLFTSAMQETMDLAAGKTLPKGQQPKSAIARGFYKLRDGKPLEGVALGTASERNEDDQEVAVEAWMMRYTEMQRLKSQLRFLHDSLKTLSPTERKSSKSLLNALTVSFAAAGVGEPKVDSTKLSTVVKGVPLKNDLLKLTIDDIKRMNDKAYSQWLDRLKGSERRCDEILNVQPGGTGVNEWLVLGEKTSAKNNLITFIPIDQLP